MFVCLPRPIISLGILTWTDRECQRHPATRISGYSPLQRSRLCMVLVVGMLVFVFCIWDLGFLILVSPVTAPYKDAAYVFRSWDGRFGIWEGRFGNLVFVFWEAILCISWYDS